MSAAPLPAAFIRCPVIGFAGFHGAQALYLCLSVFEQRGGDIRGECLAPFLKKSVILPHDKLAGPVSAVIVFLALVDGFTAAGTLADNHTLGLKQLLRVLADLRISGNQAPGHFLNARHEALRVSLALGNGRQLSFPFSRKLGRSQHIRQDAHKVVAVLGGK